jgi:hypothetical protein
MTTPTITLPDVGTVPALPDGLHPIALAARDMAPRKWGVVACPDGGDPVLYSGNLRTSVAAGRLAQTLTRAYGPRVFVVYRCTAAVTVHTAHPELPYNLIGSAPAPRRVLPAPAEMTALVVRIDALAGSLHEHAVAAHRRDRMHQHCPTCGSRVRLIRANVPEAMGNPCNNVWHDQPV